MNRIRELRKSKGMTQIRLGIKLDVSQEVISAYENGKHYPSAENLIKMSELFGASCDYILGLSDIKSVAVSGEFSQDEIILVSDFRSLSPTERKMIFHIFRELKIKSFYYKFKAETALNSVSASFIN